MDMEEDEDVPLILGRTFMKTATVIIDVDEKEMRVRGQEDGLAFDIFEGSKTFNHREGLHES